MGTTLISGRVPLEVLYAAFPWAVFFWEIDMPWGTKSRQERGYGASWDRLRKQVIERDRGLCQICLAKGIIHPGKDVDHKVSKARAKQLGWSKEQTESLSNLWYICRAEHLKKTEQEQGKTKHAPKPRIGADGWPMSD